MTTSPTPPVPALPAARGAWTAWSATWLSTLAASLGAVLVLELLSARSAEEALAAALDTHLAGQAAVAARGLRQLPVEVVAQLGGAHAQAGVEGELVALQAAGALHGLALLGPDGAVLGPEATWLPGRADADLIARAAAGEVVTGPLYRDERGALYLTAYAPLPEHPGWVVALEGSGATLGAVDVLERRLLLAGAAVVVLAGALGAVLASLVARPLRQLDTALRTAAPGDPPAAIAVQGPREVRAVAEAARRLLAGIRERDAQIAAAHENELAQVSRITAEIAHEVRNPLHAMALSAAQLVEIEEPVRRAKVAGRLHEQIRELDAIIERLVDITRPLNPRPGAVEVIGLARDVAAEVGVKLSVHGPADATLRTDRVMLAEVLRNLLLNARQAGAGEACLALEVAATELVVTLSDDGPGISLHAIPGLFRWFYTTKAGGSGLGLPLSRRLVEALGGQLHLVGPAPATFRLVLPREAP